MEPPRANLFGRFARTQLRPMCRKFYPRIYRPPLSPGEKEISACLASAIRSFWPGTPRQCGRKPDSFVYPDADSLTETIASLAMAHAPGGPLVELLLEARAPDFRPNQPHRRNQIIEMVMLAPMAVVWANPNKFRSKRVNRYIDKDASSNTPIRGRGVRKCLPIGYDLRFLEACGEPLGGRLRRKSRLGSF